MTGWKVCALALAGAASLSLPVYADEAAVKIGVMTDISGVYAALAGPGSVEAAQIAIDEVGGKVLGKPIILMSADHQNKPDIGSTIARRWYVDEGVDAIADIANSSVALAVNEITKEVKKIALYSAASSERLTEEDCSPYGVMWTWDTYSNQSGLAKAFIEQGKDSWFFIGGDYAYGKSAAASINAAVEKLGGKMLGQVFHPVGGSDFASYLLQAQSSGAKVISVASGGADLSTLMKQAKEFGIMEAGQEIVLLNANIDAVHAAGLNVMGGLRMITPFYWNRDEETRKFGEEFFKRRGVMPGESQAGVYSAVLQYLKAVEAAGTKDPDKVMEQLRSGPIEDAFARNGKLLKNGRFIHEMYLVEAKSPEASREDWDYYQLISVIPPEQAFRPIEQSVCPFLK